MKLIKLTLLERFRSLGEIAANQKVEPFTVIFRHEIPNHTWEEFHPFCFAGLNGSGKSNVLEALANIFYHLECCTLPKEYSSYLKQDFNSIKAEPCAYELEYFIIPRNQNSQSYKDCVQVIIRKEKEEAPRIKIINQDQQADDVNFSKLSNAIRTYLPELVIGYSSGENEILSLPFIKSRLLQLDEYYYHLKTNAEYELTSKPESSLVYMDYHMSQAILLANFLLQDDKTIQSIKKQLDIEKLHSFRIVINNHGLYYPEDDRELNDLLPLVKETLDKLRKCATTIYKGQIQDSKQHLIETEFMDFLINDATKAAFKKYFESPLTLFRAFQVLSFLNLRVVSNKLKREIYCSKSLYAMFKIPSLEESEHIFHFNLFQLKKENSNDRMLLKAFSDGEHQFLHTMGICLMLKDKNTLFLLDEPETHFNPEWRSEFISLLKESLNQSNTNYLMRDIIITSHSPFIISDCYPDKVIIFSKDKQPISAYDKNFRTFGTSVDMIMENIFKRNNTIGDLSAQVIRDIEQELGRRTHLTKEEVTQYKNRTRDLGDSMEKILLFAKLNELGKDA